MMHLGLSLTPFGFDPSSWPRAGAAALGFDAMASQVTLVESAGFDFVWLADREGQRPIDTLSSLATPFEPTTLIAALATRATKIGFLATAATSQHEPYNLARRLASLESISNGRTGWTVVAGEDAARETEYVELVSALWDSWEDDAFIYDKANSRFFVPEKMHVLNHNGPNFSVRGPLNVNRSPQGKPVLAAEAGSTVEHLAEIVFTGPGKSATPGLSQQPNALTFEKFDDFGGSPDEVAQRLTDRLDLGLCDGFVLQPPDVDTVRTFVEVVVPQLKNRGLLRTGYEHTTLRERLGLPYPVHPASLERAS